MEKSKMKDSGYFDMIGDVQKVLNKYGCPEEKADIWLDKKLAKLEELEHNLEVLGKTNSEEKE
jgi:hypothetical protein